MRKLVTNSRRVLASASKQPKMVDLLFSPFLSLFPHFHKSKRPFQNSRYATSTKWIKISSFHKIEEVWRSHSQLRLRVLLENMRRATKVFCIDSQEFWLAITFKLNFQCLMSDNRILVEDPSSCGVCCPDFVSGIYLDATATCNKLSLVGIDQWIQVHRASNDINELHNQFPV